MVAALPHSTRKRAKWPRVTAPAIGQSQCPFPRAGNMGFFQTLRNEPTACLTPLCLLRQKIAHCRMRNINIQTHNVNLMILPDR
ncbi:Uncharacterised protein [Salmonella enterica subsp. enterica]|uniref:Uncharacterized protein n=1 Tax=Salmonella enterica I TaxID=59201 RepID=A0A3S4HZT3_SALET|nr:Uncharacterised protein [Salmonella enterica subsp. enterica]